MKCEFSIFGCRFVGIFEGRILTLNPNIAPPFALWFTVAYLFGHLTQMSVENPRIQCADELVLRVKHTIADDDVQLIYNHEREAAEIGRTLIADVETELPAEWEKIANQSTEKPCYFI